MELLHEEATQSETVTRRVVVRSKRTRDLVIRSEPEPPDDAELYEQPHSNRQSPRNADFLKAAVSQSRKLTRDGERILFRRYRVARDSGDQAEATRIRNQIIEANLDLVGRIARRKTDSEAEYLEAFSDGVMRLLRCIDKFDPDDREAPFGAYVWVSLKWESLRIWQAERDRQARMQPIEDFNHPAVEYGDSKEAELLDSAMGKLDQRAKSIVQMKLNEPEARHRDIAAELNMSTRNAGRILKNSLDRLRHILTSESSLQDSSPVVS